MPVYLAWNWCRARRTGRGDLWQSDDQTDKGTLFKRVAGGPWIIRWYGADGKRREKSTRTTCKASAERILAKNVADAALRRDGVVDATRDRYAIEGRKPLSEHVADYIAHCGHSGQAPRHVSQKKSHLDRLLDSPGVTRLGELDSDVLERHLWSMKDDGLSARTVNFARQIAVAFMSWCVKNGRVESNRLKVVPKLNEDRDRRRIRRPLTDDELTSLLKVAESRGRKVWYLAAVFAGLRRGDLERLIWSDVNFDEGTITVRAGKAKRVDVIPMHAQLAEELLRRRTESMALPAARVFPQSVTSLTVQKDFLRAGLAREEAVLDGHGQPVMIGEGEQQRVKTRIVTEDEDGKVIDLHAMRATLGTALARAGVAPQIAQRIMRHSDYRTTQKHYTVLGLADTAKAIDQLPMFGTGERQAATGTCDVLPSDSGSTDAPQQCPRLKSQQLDRELLPSAAMPCENANVETQTAGGSNYLQNKGISGAMRPHAGGNKKAGERVRTVNIQLGRLGVGL